MEKTPLPLNRHTLKPLRECSARAPSGAHVYFCCYTDSAGDLHPFGGCLTAEEEAVNWKAELMMRRGGAVNWVKAMAILNNAGWAILDTVETEYPGT